MRPANSMEAWDEYRSLKCHRSLYKALTMRYAVGFMKFSFWSPGFLVPATCPGMTWCRNEWKDEQECADKEEVETYRRRKGAATGGTIWKIEGKKPDGPVCSIWPSKMDVVIPNGPIVPTFVLLNAPRSLGALKTNTLRYISRHTRCFVSIFFTSVRLDARNYRYHKILKKRYAQCRINIRPPFVPTGLIIITSFNGSSFARE